jgi:hypothetical protein
MTWEELRSEVYEVDGSWRDIYVLNATRADWLKWANYVNNNLTLFWNDTESSYSQTLNKIDLETIVRHFDSQQFHSSARVIINDIVVNAHFFTENEFENDIDPSQIQSMNDHNSLMDYMQAISRLLNKEVILTGENNPGYALIKISGEAIRFGE